MKWITSSYILNDHKSIKVIVAQPVKNSKLIKITNKVIAYTFHFPSVFILKSD